MRRGAERGSASVWLLSGCLALWLSASGAVAVGSAVVARHRAAAVADQAALAAAGALVAGQADPCGRAARVAEASGGEIRRCVVAGGSVSVLAEVDWRPRLPGTPPARAQARAGASVSSVSASSNPWVRP